MSKDQENLVTLLKKKGIGPTMSKGLTQEELLKLSELLNATSADLITKSTMLTALLTLPPNENERVWIDKIRHNLQKIGRAHV